MKPLLLSTYDTKDGAGRAVYRLHQGLRKIGVASNVLVRTKLSDDPQILTPVRGNLENAANWLVPNLNRILNYLLLLRYPNRFKDHFSPQYFSSLRAFDVNRLTPDIVSLHWICESYLSIETIAKFGSPTVLTLHDMWAFTGGCHYSQNCERYTESCGICPQLQSSRRQDLSRWIWKRKTQAWQRLNLTVVTPSLWLAQCVRASSLFRNTRTAIIPYGLDTERYKPIHRNLARELLGLPYNKQLILFGAMNATHDLRKGFHLLKSALQLLGQSSWQDQIELVIFGASQPPDQADLGLNARYLGKLSDDISLSLTYAAADVFVAPSTQDNLPNTVMEALACGTPCVAFKVGGMPDMIEHQQNGYLAQSFDVQDLARGITWVLENRERHQRLSERAREKVEQEFTLELQAKRYLALFDEVIRQHRADLSD